MLKFTEKDNIFVSAVIVSAGNSTRMGGVNKQFLELDNMAVIAHSIKAFENCNAIDEIVVVTREEDILEIRTLCEKYGFKKVTSVVSGGATRQKSVYNGVVSTSDNADIIAIHDGARPLVTNDAILDTLEAAIEWGAATTGVRVKDTVKKINEFGEIVGTPDRSVLRFVQTPQIFKKALYIEAVSTVENSAEFTDDCMLIEAFGRVVKFVDGDYENIKITTPEDVVIAESYLKRRRK